MVRRARGNIRKSISRRQASGPIPRGEHGVHVVHVPPHVHQELPRPPAPVHRLEPARRPPRRFPGSTSRRTGRRRAPPPRDVLPHPGVVVPGDLRQAFDGERPHTPDIDLAIAPLATGMRGTRTAPRPFILPKNGTVLRNFPRSRAPGSEEEDGDEGEDRQEDGGGVRHVAEEGRHPDAGRLGDRLDHEVGALPMYEFAPMKTAPARSPAGPARTPRPRRRPGKPLGEREEREVGGSVVQEARERPGGQKKCHGAATPSPPPRALRMSRAGIIVANIRRR